MTGSAWGPSARIWGTLDGAEGLSRACRVAGVAAGGSVRGPQRGQSLGVFRSGGLQVPPCPQFMQKKSPLYVLLKEDTVWSMDQLNRHINDKFSKTKGLPRDWVFTTFTVRGPLPTPARGAGLRVKTPHSGGGRWAQGAHTFLGSVSALKCVSRACASAWRVWQLAAGGLVTPPSLPPLPSLPPSLPL